MVAVFCSENKKIIRLHGDPSPEQVEHMLWIDLMDPTQEEEKRIEQYIGINIPTKEEMREIEPSSRLYEEEGILYLTATLISKTQQEEPETHSVTFVLTPKQLITVRYSDPLPFETFHKKLEKLPTSQHRPILILVGLLETVIDRLADILESVGQNVDLVSKNIFKRPGNIVLPKPNHEEVLHQIGRQGDLTFKARESLATLVRLISYLEQDLRNEEEPKPHHEELRERLKTMAKDANVISDYAMFISGNISFLLDGTLGIIGMEQNATIKIFTIVGVVLMPPTLIASIYGMNFQHMPPEIHSPLGYPFALMLMAISAYLPYRFFKKKGWF